MRRLCLFTMASLSAAFSLAHAQVKDGFLEFSWGADLATIQRELLLTPVGHLDLQHTFAAEVRRLAGAELEDCLLEFSAGRLSGVIITTQGRDNSRKLLALLKEQYGDGRMESPLGYQWFSPRTHAAYDEDSAGDAYVYWYALQDAEARPARDAR
jgi:hypothetical protein